MELLGMHFFKLNFNKYKIHKEKCTNQRAVAQ